MSLVFELATPSDDSDSNRADVACFIGFVKRRPDFALPDALHAQLAAGGWVDGAWRRPPAQIEGLLNLPVAIESWNLFDRLFAWEARPLDGVDRVCATYLGAAVRSFFGRGGRRAIVIRVGDPWSFLESNEARDERRRERIRLMLPDFAWRTSQTRPFEPHNPASWQGIHHLYGLRDPSMLLLPDLPDACMVEPPPPSVLVPRPPVPEGFVECSEDEAVVIDSGLRRIPAPRLDSNGFAAWELAISSARAFLADRRNRHEVLLVAALPLPDVDTRRVDGGGHVHAQADMLAYLRRIGVLRNDGNLGDADEGMASAFVQLAWPWLRTQASEDMPEALEPPDGVLAGLIAASATLRGTFRSVAGDFSMARLRDVTDAEPVPSWDLGTDGPTWQLARHICVFAQSPDGWGLQSDVTTSPQEAWRFGGASRLMSTIVRAARAAGDAVAFGMNGPTLWAELRGTIEDLLMGFWLEGAFAGVSAAEAFSVRCDRSTMTQSDLDAGRLVVEISVRPAVSIERITVVLRVGNAVGGSTRAREAA
jgi:hypothetical protein